MHTELAARMAIFHIACGKGLASLDRERRSLSEVTTQFLGWQRLSNVHGELT